MSPKKRQSGVAPPYFIAVVVALLVAVGLVVTVVFVLAAKNTDAVIAETNETYLGELSGRMSVYTGATIDEEFRKLTNIALSLTVDPRGDIERLRESLDVKDEAKTYDYLGALTANGTCYTKEEEERLFDDEREVADLTGLGKLVMSHPEYDVVEENSLMFLIPIEPLAFGEDEIVALLGATEAATLRQGLAPGGSNGGVSSDIVTADGSYVFYSPAFSGAEYRSNLFDTIREEAVFDGGYSDNDLRRALSMGSSTMVSLEQEGIRKYLYIEPLGIASWFVCTTMPYGDINFLINDLSTTLAWNALLIAVAIIAAVAVFYFFYARAMRENRVLLLEEKNKVEAAFFQVQNASMAKSEFLSRMSHEIRTPMNAIIGMTEIAFRHTDDPKRVEECLDKINLSSEHLLSLINDVLDMSRIESGKVEMKPEPFDFRGLIVSVTALCRTQAQMKGVDYETVLVGEMKEELIGDALHLNQVLLNLLSNAIKFTEEGGKVVLEVTRLFDRDDGRIWMRFDVSDTGVGIARQNLGRIFKSFEQESAYTARHYGGTGLGLAITRRYTEMMGGQVSVKSELKKGSTFTVVLPFDELLDDLVPNRIVGECKEEAKKKNHLEHDYDFEGKKVLIVEDNALNLEIVSELLDSTGVQVDTATDGEKAVTCFLQSPEGYYDLVLMDVQMPVMDGYEATKLIRAMDRGDAKTVPIFAMTANAFAEDEHKSIESGMDAHISKPIGIRTLYHEMNRYFDVSQEDREEV